MLRYQVDVALLCSALVIGIAGLPVFGNAAEGEDSAGRFQRLDRDKDGALSLEEYRAFDGAGPADVASRDFAVMDFDEDTQLSAEEFQVSRRLNVPSGARGPVPDPMSEFAHREIHRWKSLFSQADGNGDGRLTEREWPGAVLAREFAVLGEAPYSVWDRNNDKAVEPAEGEWWFGVGYGLIRADGRPLRTPQGVVVNWAYIRGLDRDGNDSLSQGEFVSQFWAGKERSPAIFRRIDANQDHVATFDELVESPSFTVDTLQTFLRADTDLDGTVRTEELSASANRWQKNLALRVVDVFDENGDGRLSFREYRMTPFANPGSDWNRRRKDTDGDGKISWSEFYLETAPSMIGQNWFAFVRLDRNRNGFLAADEFDFDVDRSKIPQSSIAQSEFENIDRNNDDQVDFKELFTSDPPPEPNEKAVRRYHKLYRYHVEWFRIADQDRNQRLTSAEFANAPSRFQPLAFATLMEQDRDGEIGATLDPVLDWTEQRLAAVLQIVRAEGRDPEGQLPLSRWPRASIGEAAPELAGVAAKEWDRNQDGRITDDECRLMLEVAYGVRLPTGELLRHPVSQLVNWASVSYFDQNGDGVLSKAEYTSKHWAGPIKSGELFRGLDTNGDGNADYNEISVSPIFLNDSVKAFFKFDADGSGYLEASEIAIGTTKAQQILVPRLLPAFDANRDGRLSLHEFRSCPLANPLTDWHRLRNDGDNDGKLSWREFYLDKSPFLLGLSYRFFHQFDVNRDGHLAANELEAKVDFRALSPELAFQIKDRDSDGRLVLTEFFPDRRPPDSDPIAIERYELRLAREEGRFLTNDLDHDQALNLTEFTQLITNPRGPLPPGGAGTSSGSRSGRSLWIVPLIFLLHGAALVGIGSYVLYHKPRRAAATHSADPSATSGTRR